MTNDLPQIMPGALPYFHRGGAVGCLILHGFMASRGEVGWLGEYLAEQGYTVYVPRLPGHSINPHDMKRMRWQDWYAQALDSYHILQQQCDKIFLIGHSMGGLLASLLATAVPADGLVIAGSPIRIPNNQMRFARLASLFRAFTYHPTGEPLQGTVKAEQERRGESVIGRVNYIPWSSRAVHELYLLIKIAYDFLPQIKMPTGLVYAIQDETILWGDHEIVAERLGTSEVETYIIEQGGHIIFQDTGREEAFHAVGDFIRQQVGLFS